MDKKYQVFVSSTFRDLKDERAAVMEGILQLGHIPAGMELFLASDMGAWDYIRKVIDASDYYVLVIGGKYGSVDSNGISFTEKEYEYARSIGIPTIALLHENPGALQRDKTDVDSAWQKLMAFREKVESRHVRVVWDSPSKLKSELVLSLNQQMNQRPGKGWIRDVTTSLSATTAVVPVDDKEEPEEQVQSEGESILETHPPLSTWSKREYENALFRGVIKDDLRYVDELTAAYFTTLSGDVEVEQLEWKATRQYWMLLADSKGSLAKLKQYAEAAPSSALIQYRLATVLNFHDEQRSAAPHYAAAVRLATDPAEKVKYCVDSAKCFFHLNDREKAESFLAQTRKLSNTNEDVFTSVLNGERIYSTLSNDAHAFLGTTEKLLELDPTNASLRFELAHKYSELGKDALSIMHYSRIQSNDRTSAAWNNLGVSLGRVNLPYLAVNALKTAKDAGETLANSNLALRLADAGFLDQAAALCNEAQLKPEYSDNILSTAKRIKEIPSEEQKEKDKIVEKAKPISDFYKDYGSAIATPTPTLVDGVWFSPDCELTLTCELGKFTARGEYQISPNRLSALTSVEASKLTYVLVIEGEIRGSVAVGRVTRTGKGSLYTPSTLLGIAMSNDTSLFILAEDGCSIKVAENIGHADFKTFVISAKSK
jgi:tetratricopeptide (TPR) repeat protein